MRFDAELLGGEFGRGAWTLHTSGGQVVTRMVVNCAGLFGDVVEERLLGEAAMTIRPRKGQFVVFDKAAAKLLRTIVLPVPSERTKGVVLARTIFAYSWSARPPRSRTTASAPPSSTRCWRC